MPSWQWANTSSWVWQGVWQIHLCMKYRYVDRNACIPIEGNHWLQGRWERLNNNNRWDVRYASRNPTVKEPDMFWRGCSGDCCSGNKARHLSMPCITRLCTAVAPSATVVSTLISIRTVRKKDCDPTAGNYSLLFFCFIHIAIQIGTEIMWVSFHFSTLQPTESSMYGGEERILGQLFFRFSPIWKERRGKRRWSDPVCINKVW